MGRRLILPKSGNFLFEKFNLDLTSLVFILLNNCTSTKGLGVLVSLKMGMFIATFKEIVVIVCFSNWS